MPARELTLAQALAVSDVVLLDTCILIAEHNGAAPDATLPLIPRPQRRTSSVALWEFLHGQGGGLIAVELRTRRRRWLEQQGIGIFELSSRVSRTFRSLLDVQDGPPGAVDCLLAAEAVAHRCPLVTYNVRDFQHVSGLLLVPR